MATITFIPVELTPFYRTVYRLNLADIVADLVDVNHVSRPLDLARYLELHSDVVNVEYGDLIPGSTCTLVVGAFSDFTIYGYLKGDTYQWSTIEYHGKRYTIHPAPCSYREALYQDGDTVNAEIGYLQTPGALCKGVDALPLLESYNILDQRFNILDDVLTPSEYRDPAKWVFDVCFTAMQQIRNNQIKGVSAYITETKHNPNVPTDLIEQLKTGDFSVFGEPVTYNETKSITQVTMELCLARLTDPAVTYNDEVWMHNIRQLELLFNQLIN